MRWLITGGCGFIGTRLVRALVENGDHTIRVVDNLSLGQPEDLAQVTSFRTAKPGKVAPMGKLAEGDVELVEGDVLDAALAKAAAKDAQIIVHLAASTGVQPSIDNPLRDCTANVVGTLNYLEAARQDGVRRFVFASSSSPISQCDPPILESMAPRPGSPYGAAKAAGEAYCSAYFHSYGVEAVALRFGNVYGPGSARKSSVVATFIRKSIAGEPLEIYGDGRQTRDFIYVDDLVRAITLAATVPGIAGEVFQIATNLETTVAGMLHKLLPLLAARGIGEARLKHAAARPGDARRNFSDTTKAFERLGWQAETKLGEGIRATVDWFLAQDRTASAAE